MDSKQSSYRADRTTDKASGLVVTAVRLADRYRHRVPSPEELMNDEGMSRATAYRWVNHLKAARPASLNSEATTHA